MDIQNLLNWSEPKEVQTKYGPRLLSKAEASPKFWDIWRSNKNELKEAGVSCTRDNSGDWSVLWWQEIPEEIKQERKNSLEQSKAVSAEIELPKPEGLDYMPFQKAGIRYALNRSGVLIGDEMGLGKTIQAIGIINADEGIKSVLIVCPKSLKLNWQRELERWLVRDLTIGIANGEWPETDIVILNYETLKKHDEKIQSKIWGACIVDEAHYIKNSKTQRSKLVKAIKCNRKIRLTGTPIVNRPAELYNIIEDLGGNWGTFFSFAKHYADAKQVKIGWDRNKKESRYAWDFTGASNLDELQRRLRESIMVRRLKADVLTELPRKIRQVIEFEPSKEQRFAIEQESSYESDSESRLSDLRAAVELSKAESEEIYLKAIDELADASQVDFAEISKLRHETALSKIPQVVDYVQSILEDDEEKKVIIGAHHHDMIDGLSNGLQEFSPVMLTGQTDLEDRQKAVDTFQNDNQCRIFIGSIQAAGVGITLTASSHVIFAELDWVPGNVTQFEDRAHRIGQTETVLVQHLVLSGSIDARMAKTIIEKQNVIDNALDVDHPSREIYKPKKSAATSETNPDELGKIAEKLTDEDIKKIHSDLRFLAGMDADRAQELNGVGFNRVDGRIGHSLAQSESLTPRQAALGQLVLKKYHRQLGE